MQPVTRKKSPARLAGKFTNAKGMKPLGAAETRGVHILFRPFSSNPCKYSQEEVEKDLRKCALYASILRGGVQQLLREGLKYLPALPRLYAPSSHMEQKP